MFKNMSPDTNIAQFEQARTKGDMRQEINLEYTNRLDCPITLNPQNATFTDVEIHARIRQRLSPGTVQRRLRYARYMEKHPYPVDFRNPTYENFIRHMDYREQIEGSGWGALKHEWESMRMFLIAWGIDPHTWRYKPPRQAKYTVRKIPFPDTVWKLIHATYHKDKYTNALIKYLLTHSFFIGWRFPSEPIVTKTTDLDVDHGILVVTSPKLNNATRQLDIEELAKRHQTYSFNNWLKWRSKVENQHSKDYLYLKPDGHPFENEGQLRSFMYKKAGKQLKQIFPEYYNYNTRHWCAVARLIRAKLLTKNFDIYEVKEWLGHTKVQTTINYVQDAKFYLKKTGFDWISRVLKNHKKMVGENTVKSINPPKTYVTSGTNGSGTVRRPPTVFLPTGEELIDKTLKIALSNIQLLTKPFRSFFLFIHHGRSCFKSGLRYLHSRNYFLFFFASFDYRTFRPPILQQLQWRCN